MYIPAMGTCRTGPHGSTACVISLLDDSLSVPTSCADLDCRYGAKCVADEEEGPRCVCDSAAVGCGEAGVAGGRATCGSDGRSYGSPCQLRLFACRMQRDIGVAHEGPCSSGECASESALVVCEIKCAPGRHSPECECSKSSSLLLGPKSINRVNFVQNGPQLFNYLEHRHTETQMNSNRRITSSVVEENYTL